MSDNEEFKENIIALLIVFVLLTLSGMWIYKHLYASPVVMQEERARIPVGTSPTLGNSSAPITVVVFSDFECPFCGKFDREVFPGVKKDFIDTGKVFFVFKQFPLSIHPRANLAAQAALCAHDQGKFWQYHDQLYNNQERLQQQNLLQYAKEIGLNATQFGACLAAEVRSGDIAVDKGIGTPIGVAGTPTFFFNGRRVPGALTSFEFAAEVARELNET